MTATAPHYRLPWSTPEAEDRRFRVFLAVAVALVLAAGAVVPWLSVPAPERSEKEEVPPKLARVLVEEEKPEPKEQPEPEPEPEEEEPKPQAPEPEPKPEPKPSRSKVEKAREKAAQSGLLKMKDELASMRESFDSSSVTKQATQTGGAEARQADREVIRDQAEATSGGIDTDELSRDTDAEQLAERETTRVSAPTPGTSGGEGEASSAGEASGGDSDQRSEKAIRAVLDSNKGSLYTLYNRALRRDPSLQGKVSFRLVIEPDGSVSECEILSSELDRPSLEKKLVARLKFIDFGAKEVARTVTHWAIDFLPY